jgi:hypothetical protein
MLIPRRLTRTLLPLGALLAVSGFAASAQAGVNPGLCHSTGARANIPSDFAVDACFDGSSLTLRNSTELVLDVARTGSVGNPSRTESDSGLAADALRLKTNDPNIFLPGDQLKFPVGLGSGTVSVRGSSENGFYAIATTIADFFPGKPNAFVGAFTGLVSELDDDLSQYQTCIVGKDWLGQLGCKALRARNVAFAVGRAVVNGGASAIVGAVLGPAEWTQWVNSTVGDVGSFLQDAHTITISASASPGEATRPGPVSGDGGSPSSGGTSESPVSGAQAPLPAGEYEVQNATGGIYWRSSPDWNTPEATPGNGFYPGTVIKVICYQSGATDVPGTTDSMWEQASWVSGGGHGLGWINEHFIADGSPINQPSPGAPACQQPASTNPTPTPTTSQPATSLPTTSPQPTETFASPPPTTTSSPQPTPAAQAWAETVGGNAHTWTDYMDAGGTQGATIPGGETVQIACKVQGFRVADGNTWWYRIASPAWSGNYYVSADAFYNDGETSGSLHGTPFVDPAVGDC